ncbi:hypothetical protein VTL71DRAFT_9693 [Oculimacula yallundae]|uniref:Uncharacterized protein n=1 Tax=Oculimacula yallundae TaxID=86028 RepID=A0ABR4BRJ6_9HELO
MAISSESQTPSTTKTEAELKREADLAAAKKAAQKARIQKLEDDYVRLSGDVEILNRGRDFVGKRRI